jgi:ubiquinone biosynthesis protein
VTEDKSPPGQPASPGQPGKPRSADTAGAAPDPFDTRKVTESIEQARQLIQGWTQNFVGSLERLAGELSVDAGQVKASSSQLGRAVASWMTPLMSAARATPRAGRIARELASVFGAYRWHDLRVRGLTPEAVRAERSALDQRSAARLTAALIELRGTAIKIGQFASTRRDLLPPAWIEALSSLQDSVPPTPTVAITARIAEELGAPVEERFASFEDSPIAAASLAQVHGAVLLDGTQVAVKVQVPGVEEQVEGDLSLLEVLGGVLGDVSPGLDLGPIVDELGRSVREELDYRLEARRAARMAADLAGDPAVRVPRVIEELSTGRVLTMERVHGERLIDFLARARQRGEGGALERDRVLAALVRTYAVQILSLGRFQADPHPGNFLVEPGGRLALLDFGALAELPDEERRGYAALVTAVIARDRDRASQLLAKLGFRVREGGDPAVLAEMADLMLDAFRATPDRPLADLDPRAAFDQAMALAREAAVILPHHFVLLGRVLSALAGLLLAERPDIDLFQLIAPHLAAAAGPDSGTDPGPPDPAAS